MINFNNDYSEGATPEVLKRLIEENLNPKTGYGLDEHSERAACLIRDQLACPTADVHFLVGGTQTNMILISSVLKPYQAVICAATGHINVHETGAIEGQGHKLLTKASPDGKLYPSGIREIVAGHTDEHMVSPALVYISQTTELGTVYKLSELEAISICCRELGLYLYIDGARLGSALTSADADINLADLARLSDAFTIGGTKNGLLFGEALILINQAWQKDFRFQIKHFGGMLAKGFLTGLQFEVLFEDNLFFKLARHANDQAGEIAKQLQQLGVSFYAKPESNQLFPIVSRQHAEALAKSFSFSEQQALNEDEVALRFVTSWATGDEAVKALIEAFRALLSDKAEAILT